MVAAPATAATGKMIGARELEAMQEHAWVVAARGSPSTRTPWSRLWLPGASAGRLDVTDPEPLPEGHPLWSEPRAL